MTTTQIHQGMPVVGRNGNQIGTVKAVDQDHILINRDWQRDVWAPSAAVRNVSGGAVQLNVDENQIGNRNWPEPSLFGASTPSFGQGQGQGTLPGYGTYGYPGYYPSTGRGNYGYGGYRYATPGYGNYTSFQGWGTYGTGQSQSQNQNFSYGTYGTYGTNQGPEWGTYEYWRQHQPGHTQNWNTGTSYGTYEGTNFGSGTYQGQGAQGSNLNYGYGTYQGNQGYTIYGVYPENQGGFGGYGTYSSNLGGWGGYGTYTTNLGTVGGVGTVGTTEHGFGSYGTYGAGQSWGTNWANASDSDIESAVCHRLTQHGHVDASNVDVSVADRVVTLRGSVDSRQAKRTAEDVAESVPGVTDVNNELTVDQGLMQKIESAV